MSISDRLEQWLTDCEEVILAVADGHLEPEPLTDERAGRLLSALRAVLEMHDHARHVEGCYACGVLNEPCDTQRAIADALGVGGAQ